MDPSENNERRVILVADDDSQVRRIMDRMLGQAGFEVLLAADDEQAVALFQAECARIDVVVLDIGLEKEGGAATFERMCGISSAFGVLMTSGDAPSEALRERLEEVGGAFLPKPFRAAMLHEAIAGLLDRNSS